MTAGLLGLSTIGAAVALPGVSGAAAPVVVTTTHNSTWGTILVLSNGTAVYRLTADPKDKSVCTGKCAIAWPPVVLAAGQKKAVGHGVSGLGTISRGHGTLQVTYQGIPLYRFVGDRTAGQVNGNLKDTWGQWWVVNPAHPRVAPTAAASSSGGSSPTTVAGSGVSY